MRYKMKGLLLFGGLALSIVARANNPYLVGVPGEFAAPIVNSSSNYTNTVPFGTILYDNSLQAFVGLTNAGTWATLAQSASNIGEIRVNTGNGYGSTNTKIRRFSTTEISTGSDITYADSSSNGGSFTINASGVYAITYWDSSSTANPSVGVSVNTTAGSTSIDSISSSERRGYNACSTGTPCHASITLHLNAGDVVRAHTDGTANSTDSRFSVFHIVRVK